jgi:hypothetical protein
MLRYVSPSSVTLADAGSYGGCLRRWWFRYVAGKPEPESAAQRAGTELHAEIEHYLRSGQRALGRLALTGFSFIPPPGDDLDVEHPLATSLETATLRPAGVPMIGYVDCINPRGVNYGASDVDATRDPPGTVEALDWKTTGQEVGRLKSASEIADTIQMAAYGAALVARGAAHVRLSHVYFFTRGSKPAKKISALRPAEKVMERWGYVEGVVRGLKGAAKALDASDVSGNLASCDAYGGCPHRSYCPQSRAATIARTFGKDPMSLLSSIKQPAAPAAPSGAASIKAEMERLRAAEAAAKAARTEVAIPEGFRAALDWLGEPRDTLPGMPAFGGAAAKVYAAVRGLEPAASGYAGSGEIGAHTVTDPAQLREIALELGMPDGAAPAPNVSSTSDAPVELLPPDAPMSAGVAAVAPEPKKKRGRPSKDTTPIAPEDLPRSPIGPSANAGADGLAVFVDCMPSIPTESLNRYVDQICAAICSQENEIDIRCGSPEGRLGFGRWRGVLGALIREAITSGKIPTGAYTLEVRGSEIGAVAADAVRGLCALYVRGLS